MVEVTCRVCMQKNNLVWLWIDCEMTGLDSQKDKLLEVSCILTDKSLASRLEGPSLVIHQSVNDLEQMDDWCKSHHKSSGLWQDVLNSEVSVSQAEDAIVSFLKDANSDKNNWILAGNSVHHDKAFLQKWMPGLMRYCHYQILDVSSVAMIMNGWYDCGIFEKRQTHRALDDIVESIGQLEFYKKFLNDKFKK